MRYCFKAALVLTGLYLGCAKPATNAATDTTAWNVKLAQALCQGDSETVKAMLGSARSVTFEDAARHAETAFGCGQEKMTFLLPGGKTHHANTLLHYACRGPKYAPRAAEAIRKGADVNREDLSGDMPFFHELCYSNEALLKLAAKTGLDFRKKNRAGKTIFHVAAEYGDLIAIKALVNAGAPVPFDAVVLKTSERVVDDTRTETVHIYGNRTAKRTIKGERTIKDITKTPLLEFTESRDPALHRLLLSKMQKPK